MMRWVVLLILLCHGVALAAPAGVPVALLVVGRQGDRTLAAREQAVVARLQDGRKKNGLTPAQLPILTYHVNIPAERKYCEGRLGIRADDLLFVGVARLAADRLPGEVLEGRGGIVDAAGAAPYMTRAVAFLAKPGGSADAQATYALEAAAGDQAMRARDYAAAVTHYETAAGVLPGEWRIVAREASALIALQRWDEARAAAVKAAHLAPKESLPHGLIGLACAGQGRTAEARTQLAQAVALSPGWAVPHAWTAQLEMAARRMDAASDEAMKALALDPKLALAHYVLGTMAVQGWQLQPAIIHLRAAVYIEPEWTSPIDMLGWALVLQGKYADAETAYQQLAQLSPGGSEAPFGMSLSRHAAGDDRSALAWIDRALVLRPQDATLVAFRGFVLAALGRGQEALETAQRAVRMDPKNPNAYEATGDALSALKRWDGAIQEYARAAQVLRGWPEPELFCKWAKACQAAGRHDEAVGVARELRTRYPGSPWIHRLPVGM